MTARYFPVTGLTKLRLLRPEKRPVQRQRLFRLLIPALRSVLAGVQVALGEPPINQDIESPHHDHDRDG
jgi:hypothetical protein